MSIWRCFCRQSLQLLLRVFAHERQIPAVRPPPLLTSDHRIIYLLPYRSAIDLLALQRYCLNRQLPDPLATEILQGQASAHYLFLNEGVDLLDKIELDQPSVQSLLQHLNLLQAQASVDFQIVLVTLMWGRSPGYGRAGLNRVSWRWLTAWRKFFSLVKFGRDLFIHLAPPLSLQSVSQRLAIDKPLDIQKWARLACRFWARHYWMVAGPALPQRSQLLQHCLQIPTLQAAMANEARSKQKDLALIERQVLAMFNEMAAHFSYGLLRFSYRLFSWLWNRLYQGIVINEIKPIRQRVLAGHEIVYLPCHRSHMDYLLLSYVLYREGLVPPHIAAGINLNFWPVGTLFRRTGAFFIRRSFKGNKLYSMALQSYLATLFSQGCPVEYFIEGGRSRTGRLLAPKTGLLSMTLQALLGGTPRPVVLVPVYIGYEHVVEASTYAKELAGHVKQPESLWQLLRSLKNLRHLGRSYVNFGAPISLNSDLNPPVLEGKFEGTAGNLTRSNGLQTLVNPLAQKVMVAINRAAAVNAVNLCVTVLLVAEQQRLPRALLARQLTCYLQLLRQAPYSSSCTLPTESVEALIEQAIKLGKVLPLTPDEPESILALPPTQVAELSYYRHNIQHLLVLPSLIANLLLNQPGISATVMAQLINLLYPVLQADLFLDYSEPSLVERIRTVIESLSNQQLIRFRGEGYRSDPSTVAMLALLAADTQELLQCYLLTVQWLLRYPHWSRRTLEAQMASVAGTISEGVALRVRGFFDKGSTVIATLQAAGAALLGCLETLLPPAQVASIKALRPESSRNSV
ncbi:glycerol-3-phosphate 1-O-acyltransferase PlsB [unidentified bacterial endosymbiont]|uniref:glycerol-3-phosphate 1-O-acyltransferase PlsB n=1 Tax=unidentified bacterial endosymbiont TaxID=2355 RepID=UPI00209D4BF6|nr:glycerol-3-phosphate 1-O-acyltransferase PlsB [unidentified bacterial endosymbiont]